MAFQLQAAGYIPTELSTEAAVSLDPDRQGFRISSSALTLRDTVPKLDQQTFASLEGRRAELPGLQSPRGGNHAGCQTSLLRLERSIPLACNRERSRDWMSSRRCCRSQPIRVVSLISDQCFSRSDAARDRGTSFQAAMRPRLISDLVFKAWSGKVSHLVSPIACCNIALKLNTSDVGSSAVLLRANCANMDAVIKLGTAHSQNRCGLGDVESQAKCVGRSRGSG